ncbi:efflux RND transporter periplasmic adaptor subunit [Wenyingzhuangia aestuarii]|uniref:efflux RND transporter periplasmic adaptor subunit n=1 Tax=Wenyingzhuangia aestuarii TaxID=1647582 RepID=UPI00143C456C|nr:efflux RND transporter periplasmic adaptor subunit [Wenyingzhuangia aestuarii]NJB84104.1 Cu(I)/Ag(I) efflux system membrane fusion protein [Wenyingzhuangia aestuarii]
MKKYIVYIGILVVGMLLGSWFFGYSGSKETSPKHSEVTVEKEMWTCSMHPQIMKSEPGDCPICGMDLIPAASSAEGLLANQFKLSENAMALANIQTTMVGTTNTEEKAVNLSGKISINADETAIQPAHFNGRIEKLYITSLGERVYKGQKVADIYSPELVAAQQELITANELKESQPELFKAIHQKFKNWMVHGPQLEEVLRTGNVKTSFAIYAHVDGVVSEIAVSDGAHIMDGKSIFKVANLNSVWANFDVYEHQIDRFKIGQRIKIKTNATSHKAYTGVVSFIDPVLNQQTRTVNLRVVLENKNGALKPGMFVTGTVALKEMETEETLRIPASAILWTGKRSVVYQKVHATEPVFEMREVVLGNKTNDVYEILEGLSVGDEIVMNGTFTVDAAAQLQGKKSMMNKKGGKTLTGHEAHVGMNMPTSSSSDDVLKSNERIQVASAFQEQLHVIYEDYIVIKNALTKDDSETVVVASKTLLQNLTKVNMKLLTEKKAHQQWMSAKIDLEAMAKLLAASKEIEEQRTHFKKLSMAFIKVIQVFGIQEKVYQQHCPMSDSNKGADWLSSEKKVINPYFGKTMLTCGEVTQIIE